MLYTSLTEKQKEYVYFPEVFSFRHTSLHPAKVAFRAVILSLDSEALQTFWYLKEWYLWWHIWHGSTRSWNATLWVFNSL